MKKNIATKLNDIAENLPTIWEWELGLAEFTGEEMNLSGFGETEKFDRLIIYSVEVPQMRAVEHKQQLKDAYKRGGDRAVELYVNGVIKKFHAYSNN